MAWITARAWLDDDGRHVWMRHECKNGLLDTMLPCPKWHAIEGKVEPSVNCADCGLHAFLKIEARP